MFRGYTEGSAGLIWSGLATDIGLPLITKRITGHGVSCSPFAVYLTTLSYTPPARF